MAGPAAGVAEGLDFFGVGGDDYIVEGGAGFGRSVDPGEERLAGDGEQDFAGEAGGGQAGGDDSDDATEGGVSGHAA